MLDEFESAEKQRMQEISGSTRAFGRLRPGLEHLRQTRSECRRTLFDHICGLPERQNLVSEAMQKLAVAVEHQAGVQMKPHRDLTRCELQGCIRSRFMQSDSLLGNGDMSRATANK
jgi:hypothetical protein